MIYKISPHPSLPKRGREKAEMTHSITRRAFTVKENGNVTSDRRTEYPWNCFGR